jgi:site-specific recombinase XerD
MKNDLFNAMIVMPSNSGGRQVLEQIAAWETAAQGAYSTNTQRAYRTDWRCFQAYCAGQGIESLPAAAESVAAFLRGECARGRAVATVRRRAAAVSPAHRAAQLTDPCKSEPVRLALRAIARERDTQRKQAAPLGHREADKIVASIDAADARPKDVRDLALMLLGRDLLARASELVSITVENITFDTDDTAVILLRRHKTSTEALPYQIGPDATAALARWLKLPGIAAGPVFRSVTKRSLRHETRLNPYPLWNGIRLSAYTCEAAA